jgi:hypothetical protein
MAKILGINSHFLINGIELPFREMDFEVQRMVQENTGSTHYDPDGGVIYRTQRVVKLWTSMRVTGLYDTTAVPAALLGFLFSGATGIPCTLFSPGSLISGRGLMDVLEFRSRIQFDNIVEYNLNATSYGFWTTL